MSLDAWDEVRTAFHVARLGTVSGAADALGVHHATVIRHIDALEGRLGAKLFQRHARGYTPTEAGTDLLQVAKTTEDQFSQLASRIRGRGAEVSGELIITSIDAMSAVVVPMLADFSAAHPEVTLRYITDERVFRLEYGEAHLAIRAGSRPNEPDNVVQPFFRTKQALFASKTYFEKFGPLAEGEWEGHRFIGAEGFMERAPFFLWLTNSIPAEQIVLRTSDQRSMQDAVRAHAGIGFMSDWLGGQQPDLVQMMAPKEEWAADIWLVTHVDLHRTAKVQAILEHLKAQIKALDL